MDDPVLTRELVALGDMLDVLKRRSGQGENVFARLLLGPTSPDAARQYEECVDLHEELNEAVDPSTLSFDELNMRIREDLGRVGALCQLLNSELQSSEAAVASASASSTAGGDRSAFPGLPLRLYHLTLQIRELQAERSRRLAPYVEWLDSQGEEVLSVQLTMFRSDLARLPSLALPTPAGLTGPLLLRDPIPEERRFLEEAIARTEARAVSRGGRALADASTLDQLRDRLERIKVAVQMEREHNPPPPATTKPRSEAERFIDDLVKLTVTLRQFDELSGPIVAEFPELKTFVDRRRRELLDKMRDPT